MNIEVNNIDKTQQELTITLSPEEMEPFLNEAAKHLAKNMKVKGFREGHVPRNVVENSVGAETLWREAAPGAIEDAYWKAVEQKDIQAIGMPEVNVVTLVPGNDFVFKATVPVMPDLELPDYKKIARDVIKEEDKEVTVDEKELEESLQYLQRSRAGGAGTEEKDGSAAEKEPKLDDEFARSVGDFKNLEDLKKNMRQGLKHEKETRQKQATRLRILEEIAKKVDLKIPESLIKAELDKMQDELAQQVSQMGMTLDQYMEQAKKNLEEVREGWRDKAKERVVSAIILHAIADAEDVEIPEEELEKEANKYLQRFGDTEEAQKEIDPARLRSYIRGILKNEKVFELLEQQNKE